jgi:hypothetical protein
MEHHLKTGTLMKTKLILLAGASMLTIFSCESNKYSDVDQVKATSDLETFVDSVETVAKMRPLPDWSITDKRFGELESTAKEINKDLGVEDTEVIALEERYQDAVDDAKQEAENFDRSADLHMKNVEAWWDNKSKEMKTGTKIASTEIEASTKESMDWLTANFDNLSDAAKEKFTKISTDVSLN